MSNGVYWKPVRTLWVNDDKSEAVGVNGCKSITLDNLGVGDPGPYERLVVEFDDGRQQIFVASRVLGWEFRK